MPPPGTGAPLNDDQIVLIRQWIDKGHFVDPSEVHEPREREFTKAEAPDVTAKDREFWSFRKPQAAPVPKVKAANRVRTPIDAFVLANAGTKRGWLFPPTRPREHSFAERISICSHAAHSRRSYGIPERPQKPGAYERLIDRLLASPQYGERWGRHWLDAAGYVDTQAKDFRRHQIRYRRGDVALSAITLSRQPTTTSPGADS
jgi:hypothetical protein